MMAGRQPLPLADMKEQANVPDPPRRKVNNIWMRLAEEERLTETLTEFSAMGVEVDEDRVKFDRGPESFYIEKNTYEEFRNRVKKRKAPVETEVSSDESMESDSSLTSGGISDGAMSLLRKRKGPKSKKSWKRRGKKETKTGDADAELLWDETVEDFVDRLSRELSEHNTELLKKVVNLIGIPATFRIKQKVLKIEKFGGIMVKDGSRRRSPGGVFFYLLQRHRTTMSPALKRILTTKANPKKKPGHKVL